MLRYFYFLIFILLIPNVHASLGQEGHGGDIAVSIFMGTAQEIEHRANLHTDKLPFANFSFEFHQAFLNTKVYSVDRTELNGEEVDAINYPDRDNPKILINRARWLDSNLNFEMRALLVCHEYLSIMGYDDSLYSISYPFIQKIKETQQ